MLDWQLVLNLPGQYECIRDLAPKGAILVPLFIRLMNPNGQKTKGVLPHHYMGGGGQ